MSVSGVVTDSTELGRASIDPSPAQPPHCSLLWTDNTRTAADSRPAVEQLGSADNKHSQTAQINIESSFSRQDGQETPAVPAVSPLPL